MNSSVSRCIASRRLSSNSGNRLTSGVTARMFRSSSHCAAKLLTSADERGSASIRRTCAASTARSFSFPLSAASSSSSSGMLLHRKNDSREASSRSLMR